MPARAHSPLDVVADKKRLRLSALSHRAAMGEEMRAAASRIAAGNALGVIGPAAGRTIALFAPFRDEIDTFPLAAALRESGAALALPVIAAREAPLLFRRWDEGATLFPHGTFCIPEPAPDAAEVTPDVLLVPLAAFDRRGYRIGYGAGLYDRTLAALRALRPVTAIGFAFACQEVNAVPHEPHDEPVDMMVTEIEAASCAVPR